jgi:hypothetical protein
MGQFCRINIPVCPEVSSSQHQKPPIAFDASSGFPRSSQGVDFLSVLTISCITNFTAAAHVLSFRILV